MRVSRRARIHGFPAAMTLSLALTAPSLGCSKNETSSGDTTAPAAVTDLGFGPVTARNVTLIWTAPGDDGTVGTAHGYDIRYSLSPISSGNWGQAHTIAGEPAPQVPGTQQEFTVTQLTPYTRHYFALVAEDEAGNSSGLSNVADTTTARQYRRLNVSAGGTFPYTTITDAIAAVAENDTIFVYPGVYNEALTVSGKHFVLLGYDADQAIVQYDATEVSAPVLTVGDGADLEIRRMRFVQQFISCGAGVQVEGSTLVMEDCIVARCGIEASNTDLTLRRCTIWRMPAMLCDAILPLVSLSAGHVHIEQSIIGLAGQGVSCIGGAQVDFVCNDCWGMPDPDLNYPGCDDPTGSNGNISQDPRFVNFMDEIFHLQDDSPCRADATPGCGRMGALD